MIAKARAKFYGGALHPLEPLDLAEGQEVLISIQVVPPGDSLEVVAPHWPKTVKDELTVEEQMKRTMSSAGALKGKIDGEELKRTLYEARRTGSREMPDS